jgi:hypothetical protein
MKTYNNMATPAAKYQYSIRLFNREYLLSVQSTLLLIVAAAILLRVLSALVQGNTVTILPGIYDQVSYDGLARRVAGGYGFSFATEYWPMTRAGQPTAHWSFLYTLYLAIIYKLLGPQPLIARLFQAVIVGGLQTYVIFQIAEKVFARNVGLISAGITAVYIYFIYYSGALMTEPFYITAILYSLYVAIHLSESTSKQRDLRLAVCLGIAIGITVLLRQVFLLFIPFLFLWIWIARFRRRLGLPIISTVISFSLIILCIIPFTIYNWSRFGRFVLLNTNSGYAFFWGNNPIYGTHFVPILSGASYQDLIPKQVRNLDEAALDQELLRRGIQFVADDPRRFVLLSMSRIPVYFMFWPSSDSGLISNISRVASFGITLPFMLAGIVIAVRKKWLEKGNRFLNLLISPEGLLLIFVLVYSMIHLLTWALIRYRLPVDAVLIPFAAVSIETLITSYFH